MAAKGEIIRTAIAALALVISTIALVSQYRQQAETRAERAETKAEVLDYEIGTERANPKQYDEYFKIYNRSRGEIRLESVSLRADMGDGLFKRVVLFEPQKPEALPSGDVKEFRFRLSNPSAEDEAAEKKPGYSTFTGKSTVEVVTTRGTKLSFESDYSPYLLDRIYSSLKLRGEKKEVVNVR
jgi:hypothetical protein